MKLKEVVKLRGLYTFLAMKRFGLKGMINNGEATRKYKET